MIVYNKLLLKDLKNNKKLVFYKNPSIAYTITQKGKKIYVIKQTSDRQKTLSHSEFTDLESAYRNVTSNELIYKEKIKDYRE